MCVYVCVYLYIYIYNLSLFTICIYTYILCVYIYIYIYNTARDRGAHGRCSPGASIVFCLKQRDLIMLRIGMCYSLVSLFVYVSHDYSY